MLEREPLNGAELMDRVDRMTMGWWRPSPGSIYPLLEELEKEKLIVKRSDGRYEVAPSARGGPDWMRGFGFPGAMGPRTPEDALRELESYTRYLEDLPATERDRVADLSDRLRSVARRIDTLGQSGR